MTCRNVDSELPCYPIFTRRQKTVHFWNISPFSKFPNIRGFGSLVSSTHSCNIIQAHVFKTTFCQWLPNFCLQLRLLPWTLTCISTCLFDISIGISNRYHQHNGENWTPDRSLCFMKWWTENSKVDVNCMRSHLKPLKYRSSAIVKGYVSKIPL